MFSMVCLFHGIREKVVEKKIEQVKCVELTKDKPVIQTETVVKEVPTTQVIKEVEQVEVKGEMFFFE